MKVILFITIALFSTHSMANHACAEEVRSLAPQIKQLALRFYNDNNTTLSQDVFNQCLNFLENGGKRKSCKSSSPEWSAISQTLMIQARPIIRRMCVSHRNACYDGCVQIGLAIPRGGVPYAISRINGHYFTLESSDNVETGNSSQ